MWRAIEPSNVLWVNWGDDYVLYHRPSGKTHFVNTATAYLLGIVLCEPKSALAASAALAGFGRAAEDEKFGAEIADLLVRLEHVGLVNRCDD